MRHLLLLLAILLTPAIAAAQKQVNQKIRAQILDEGYRLYRSEMASWRGTDLFLENYPELREKAGGYFSYEHNDSTRCIFFSKGEQPQALISFTFDNSFTTDRAKVAQQERPFTKLERDLYQVRKAALAEINADTLFQQYNNTNLNLVPLIKGKEKKVYVLTGPQLQGVVILGNDYLLTFDSNNKVKSKQKLHQNIIPIDFKADSVEEASTMHTHLPSTGGYMTPTDICTLLLYGQMSQWKQHYTLSQNFISIWDVEKRDLVMLTRKAWEKIMQHQEAKRQKN
ncbi:hypothetical protein [Pontibacter chinhatensis]|uniref:Uncharacterized protein n=1 Tax=Pontibacter chinhatensis TaxID=1436961 RepID=A0A1I2UAZ1_9BACT|nr:hypothetical protein [Pontibacter chinhatensis]SFG74230.1 hypothetical protein SAMN05421739_103464 [Pontibacter chinhatensis]